MRRISLAAYSAIIAVIIMAVAVLVVLIGVADYTDTYRERNAEQVRTAVQSHVAQCYALEGQYPPDLSYLEEYYGLQLDADAYIYHYELFASNIYPEVRVFAKAKAGD